MRSTTLVFMASLLCASPRADDGKNDYELRVKVYKILPEAITQSGEIRGVKLSVRNAEPFVQPVKQGTEPAFDFRENSVMMLETEPLWNEKREPDVPGVISLGTAQKTIQSGRAVEVAIEEGRPIQYFKPLHDDLYELVTLDMRQGIRFELTVQPEGEWLRLKHSAKLTLLREQDPADTDGPAGSLTWATTPPVIATTTTEGSGLVKPKTWFGSVVPVPQVGSVWVLIWIAPAQGG